MRNSLEAWLTETCGLLIKNVSKSDEGYWRLTSINGKEDITRGTVFVQVRGIFSKTFFIFNRLTLILTFKMTFVMFNQ